MTASNCCTPIKSVPIVKESAIPAPLFKLFDVAILHHESESGTVSNELIQILGIIWSPHYARSAGWWYHVRYLNEPTGIDSHLPLGHEEDCKEDELRAVQIGIF